MCAHWREKGFTIRKSLLKFDFHKFILKIMALYLGDSSVHWVSKAEGLLVSLSGLKETSTNGKSTQEQATLRSHASNHNSEDTKPQTVSCD